MAKIIVFHFSEPARIPALSDSECEKIREAYNCVIVEYSSVALLGVFVAEDGRAICEWEAPNAQVVEEIITRVDGRPPLDGAIQVTKIL